MQAIDREDLELVVAALRSAGDIAREGYAATPKSWEKSKGNPVTETDIAVDLPLPENETRIVVTRAEGRIRLATLADLDYRLLEAMADRKTVAEVEQMAIETHPEFDFTRFMTSIMALNVLAGVSVEVLS